MLKDIIDFVVSRTSLPRDAALREINYAWREIWNTDDLVGSLFEVTVKAVDSTQLVTLPHFVGLLKAVKSNSMLSVDLNTPRPYYHDNAYKQSPWEWRIMGVSPLARTIANATTLNLSIAEAESAQFTVSLQGPTDHAAASIDRIVFEPGDTEKESVLRFTDLNSATKNALTNSNLVITGANGEELGYIANSEYEARNTVVQITNKCVTDCTSCRCFDVLFKKPAPILVHEETTLPYEEVIMTKTLEWIMLPKEGGAEKAVMFSDKSNALKSAYNRGKPEEHKMSFGINHFVTRYSGSL